MNFQILYYTIKWICSCQDFVYFFYFLLLNFFKFFCISFNLLIFNLIFFECLFLTILHWLIRLRERLDASIVRRKQFEQQTKMKRWESERFCFAFFFLLLLFYRFFRIFLFRVLAVTVTVYYLWYFRALRRAQSEVTETPTFFQSSNSFLPFETAG